MLCASIQKIEEYCIFINTKTEQTEIKAGEKEAKIEIRT